MQREMRANGLFGQVEVIKRKIRPIFLAKWVWPDKPLLPTVSTAKRFSALLNLFGMTLPTKHVLAEIGLPAAFGWSSACKTFSRKARAAVTGSMVAFRDLSFTSTPHCSAVVAKVGFLSEKFQVMKSSNNDVPSHPIQCPWKYLPVNLHDGVRVIYISPVTGEAIGNMPLGFLS